MRELLGYVASVLILLTAGVGLLATGRMEQRLVDARIELLTLQRATTAEETSGLGPSNEASLRFPWMVGLAGEFREQRATSAYWQEKYSALTLDRDASGTVVEQDPMMMLLAANAAYRRIRLDGTDPTAVQRLDEVLSQYAELLRRAPQEFDAAFNYELVSRTRDRLGRPRTGRSESTRDRSATAAKPTPTIHGQPGMPAAESDSGDFKIIVPRSGDERRPQPEAGSGGAKVRKG